MARAKFERPQVVAAATELFSKQGYNAASMQDVFRVTGLQPGSLYNAFGSKDKLFEETLRYYGQAQRSALNNAFEKADNPLVTVCHILASFVREGCESDYSGCFLVKAQLEMQSVGHQHLSSIVAEELGQCEAVFERALASRYSGRQLQTRATALVMVIFGLRVCGYQRRSAEQLMGATIENLPWLPWKDSGVESTTDLAELPQLSLA